MNPPAFPPTPESRSPFWDWRDVALFLSLSIPCLFLALAITRGIFLLWPSPSTEAVRTFTLQFLAYAFWFAALWAMLKTRYNQPFWRSLGWNVPWSGVSWSIVLGPALALSIAVLGAALSTPQIDNPIRKLISDRTSAILVGAFATTLGPLAEELVFRGFLLPLAVRSVGVAAGLTITNLPFALLHGPQYGWTWQHMVLLFIASTAFGYTRLRTGSTAASTLVHAGYNATFFVALIAQGRFYG